MKYLFKVNLVFVLISIMGCSSLLATPTPTPTPTLTPTPTPIPLSEVELEPILITSGDLPAGYSGAQISSSSFEMFDNIDNFENVISQQFEKGGEVAGGVTVFLFDLMNDRDNAYHLIIDGFGKSGNDSGVSTHVGDIANIGEKAMFVTIEIDSPLLGLKIVNEDLAFARCHAVVHIRMGDTSEIDYLTGYASRLDKRLSELVCR